MNRVLKVKGTANHAPEKECRLSTMDAAPPFNDAPPSIERDYDNRYRKVSLGATQHPTQPKEGFSDEEAPMLMGSMSGFY